MKQVGAMLIVLTIPAIAMSRWLWFPIGISTCGLSLTLLGHATTRVTWASYGAAEAVLLMIAAVAWASSRPRGVCIAGLLVVLLAATAGLEAAFANPELLLRLLREADWSNAARTFGTRYLRPNRGLEPAQANYFVFGSPGARLLTALHFMGMGWYLAIGVGSAVLMAGAGSTSARFRLRAFLMALAVVAGLLVGFMSGPIRADWALAAGETAEAGRRLSDALADYRFATKADVWNALDVNLYARIGRIQRDQGQLGTPEYQIYKAEYSLRQGRYVDAIDTYKALAATETQLGAVARRRGAELLTEEGEHLYEVGAFGAAVDAWRQALTLEPSSVLAAFYLSRGYFALGQYDMAVKIVEQSSREVQDPVFLADLYSSMGDARMRAGASGAAHVAYRGSYSLDYVANFCALSGLMGF